MHAAGLIPMLGVPLAGGAAGTESLLAQALAAASSRGLVQPGSHVVVAMSYRGDLVLQARPGRLPHPSCSPCIPDVQQCSVLCVCALRSAAATMSGPLLPGLPARQDPKLPARQARAVQLPTMWPHWQLAAAWRASHVAVPSLHGSRPWLYDVLCVSIHDHFVLAVCCCPDHMRYCSPRCTAVSCSSLAAMHQRGCTSSLHEVAATAA